MTRGQNTPELQEKTEPNVPKVDPKKAEPTLGAEKRKPTPVPVTTGVSPEKKKQRFEADLED